MSESMAFEGGCHCGAVRFRVEGKPLWVVHCHCDDCRNTSAAPVSTFVGVRDTDFTVTKGERRAYASSPGVARSFCAACGTPLTYEGARFPGEVHILIGALDEPARFTPRAHVHTVDQLPWLKMDDGLKRFTHSS